MAISIDFLDFYGALFERSCDAVNAMAAALNTFYTRRGYFLVNPKVQYNLDDLNVTHITNIPGRAFQRAIPSGSGIRCSVA